jgi:hypothetical protein
LRPGAAIPAAELLPCRVLAITVAILLVLSLAGAGAAEIQGKIQSVEVNR